MWCVVAGALAILFASSVLANHVKNTLEKQRTLRILREQYDNIYTECRIYISSFYKLRKEIGEHGGWFYFFDYKEIYDNWYRIRVPDHNTKKIDSVRKMREIVNEMRSFTDNLKERCALLDRYLSYIKGWSPLGYIENVVVDSKRELFSSAVKIAISDPKYSARVRERWVGAREEFLSAAEVVGAIYNFAKSGVRYKSDDEAFEGKLEVYIPPDKMLENIMRGELAYGDCEDQAILFMSLMWRAILDNVVNLPLSSIYVEERELWVPQRLRVWAIDVFGKIYIIHWWWEKVCFGHAFAVVLMPHPYNEGENLRVPIELTHILPDGSPAPWDTWIKYSPSENEIIEKYKITVLDETLENYPLVGRFRENYEPTKYPWRIYGPCPAVFALDLRTIFYMPEQNRRD